MGAASVRITHVGDAGVWTAPGGARVAWFLDPDGTTLSLDQEPR